MLRSALWCVGLAAVAAFAYAFQIESGLFRAAGLELCLCGTAIWAALDAAKARRRLDRDDREGALARKRETSAVHHLFVAAPTVAVIVFSVLSLLSQLVEIPRPQSQQQVIGGAIAAVLAASLWTVFARSLKQASTDAFPELSAVRDALSEARLAALVAGGALLVATVYRPTEGWAAWVISLWTLAVAGEQLLRTLAGWFRPITQDDPLVAPVHSLLREVFLSTTNPVGALFDIAESRFGLSLRSSWTIRFFRRSVLPITIGCVLIVWLATCFVVIEPHQAGLRERFGVAEPTKLEPGLHTKLPWPFGTIRRYPAGVVQTMQVGFEEPVDEGVVSLDQERSLLWTKPHEQEFSLVLGSETELVAINAIVYFQIADDVDGFLKHAFATSNPESALEAFAYRVLMEETRSSTLDEILSRGRDDFAATIRRRLSEYSESNDLGLEIVDVALINLHPPVQVATNYLDVINAELDSSRVVTAAKGEASKQVLDAETESGLRVATAKIDAAKRVSEAGRESAEFLAVGEAYAAAPETYRLRLWFEAFERVLFGRRLFVIDAALPNVIFDERADTTKTTLPEAAISSRPE